MTSLDPELPYYRSRELCDLLNLSMHALERLRKAGALPYQKIGDWPYYDKEYIDDLAVTWARYPDEFREICDTTFFRLHVLHWQYRHPPADCTTAYKRAMYRKRLHEACEKLVASGQIRDLASLAPMIEKTLRTVKNWAWSNKIVTIPVGKTHYVTRQYARCLMVLLIDWITADEAAELTGLHRTTVAKKIKEGEFGGLTAPDGFWRVKPETLTAYLTPEFEGVGKDETPLTVEEAASILGVTSHLLFDEVSANRVASVGEKGARRIPKEEVMKWKERFTHLNEGFAWLELIVMPNGAKPLTMEPKIARKKLGIVESALTRWCKADVLPFYVWSFTLGLHEKRVFVSRYILGLCEFAGGGKVTMRVARRYLQVCKDNSQIM